MECFRMHYTLLSILIIAVKVSDANIQFQGIEPKTVLVGDNVTFRWLYSGNSKPVATSLEVLDGSKSKRLLYFGFGYGAIAPQYNPDRVVKRYSEFVNWTGNVSRNEFAFTLTEVKEFSHGKSFSVKISFGLPKDEVGAILLFISVRPNVTLLIENTNVTVNDVVTIECRMVEKGRPEANISWFHNNELLPDKNDLYLFNRREVELKDSGSYKCVAENDAGISESKVKSLMVNKKPGKVGKGPSSGKSSGGLEAGAIAGIVIAILVVIVLVSIAVIMLKKKKEKSTPKTNKAAGNDETKSPMVSNPPERDQVWL